MAVVTNFRSCACTSYSEYLRVFDFDKGDSESGVMVEKSNRAAGEFLNTPSHDDVKLARVDASYCVPEFANVCDTQVMSEAFENTVNSKSWALLFTAAPSRENETQSSLARWH